MPRKTTGKFDNQSNVPFGDRLYNHHVDLWMVLPSFSWSGALISTSALPELVPCGTLPLPAHPTLHFISCHLLELVQKTRGIPKCVVLLVLLTDTGI